MSSAEFTAWQIYFEAHPWGEERADYRAGLIASVIANVNRNPKKRKKPYKPEDFMPKISRSSQRKKRKTWQEQLSMVEMLNAAFGGKDQRK